MYLNDKDDSQPVQQWLTSMHYYYFKYQTMHSWIVWCSLESFDLWVTWHTCSFTILVKTYSVSSENCQNCFLFLQFFAYISWMLQAVSMKITFHFCDRICGFKWMIQRTQIVTICKQITAKNCFSITTHTRNVVQGSDLYLDTHWGLLYTWFSGAMCSTDWEDRSRIMNFSSRSCSLKFGLFSLTSVSYNEDVIGGNCTFLYNFTSHSRRCVMNR